MPQVFRNFALGFAILVFGIWGALLIFAPHLVHSTFSADTINYAYAGMMGAALLGLAVISLAAEIGWPSSSRALGIAVAILVVVAGYLMFGSNVMLVTPITAMSIVAAGSVAVFLVMFG